MLRNVDTCVLTAPLSVVSVRVDLRKHIKSRLEQGLQTWSDGVTKPGRRRSEEHQTSENTETHDTKFGWMPTYNRQKHPNTSCLVESTGGVII